MKFCSFGLPISSSSQLFSCGTLTDVRMSFVIIKLNLGFEILLGDPIEEFPKLGFEEKTLLKNTNYD